MYLIVIAWLYVTLMMGLAEAFSSQGTILGAIITFVFYGLLPMALVVYLMGTPLRRKAIRKSELEAQQAYQAKTSEAAAVNTISSPQPDASGHAAGLAASPAVTAVRKEDIRL